MPFWHWIIVTESNHASKHCIVNLVCLILLFMAFSDYYDSLDSDHFLTSINQWYLKYLLGRIPVPILHWPFVVKVRATKWSDGWESSVGQNFSCDFGHFEKSFHFPYSHLFANSCFLNPVELVSFENRFLLLDISPRGVQNWLRSRQCAVCLYSLIVTGVSDQSPLITNFRKEISALYFECPNVVTIENHCVCYFTAFLVWKIEVRIEYHGNLAFCSIYFHFYGIRRDLRVVGTWCFAKFEFSCFWWILYRAESQKFEWELVINVVWLAEPLGQITK